MMIFQVAGMIIQKILMKNTTHKNTSIAPIFANIFSEKNFLIYIANAEGSDGSSFATEIFSYSCELSSLSVSFVSLIGSLICSDTTSVTCSRAIFGSNLTDFSDFFFRSRICSSQFAKTSNLSCIKFVERNTNLKMIQNIIHQINKSSSR
jgi:hypothetical protein